MSEKNSLPARGPDPPFSPKSIVSITHEQNIICSKTLELSANEKEGKKTSKDNNYYTCHILLKPYLTLPVNMTTLHTAVLNLHCTQNQIITDGFLGGCFAAIPEVIDDVIIDLFSAYPLHCQHC